ncbi:MAG: hypothetical protein JOZ58_18035 [Acetobacteraceae bacterium]|nr:hypothetical protein [Acetobacteraceae bacterium]MBV8576924.1 hypothetical protein [Acetobacteraceae bacterium]
MRNASCGVRSVMLTRINLGLGAAEVALMSPFSSEGVLVVEAIRHGRLPVVAMLAVQKHFLAALLDQALR